MKNFVITSENQQQVNDAVMQLMDVFNSTISYEEMMCSFFRGSSEILLRMAENDENYLYNDIATMIYAIRHLSQGLTKFETLNA